jgi:predicted dehydrogenase
VPATNVAIIGCGGIAALSHVPAIWRRSSDVSIRYLCDLDRSRAEWLRQRCRIPETSIVDVEMILGDDEIEGVIVTTWPTSHTDLALAAIAAGKHVLVQKPAALTGTEGAALLSAARSSDRNVLALPILDFVPGIRQLADLITNGVLGVISFVRVRVSIPGPVDYHRDVHRFFQEPLDRAGSVFDPRYAHEMGCSADMGPYALSLIYHLFGPAELVGIYKASETFERSCLLSLILPESVITGGPAQCSLELGWSQFASEEMCVVMGSNATAYVTMTGRLTVNPDDSDEARTAGPVRSGSVLPPDPATAQDRWLDAIRSGRSQSFDASVAAADWASGILERIRNH